MNGKSGVVNRFSAKRTLLILGSSGLCVAGIFLAPLSNAAASSKAKGDCTSANGVKIKDNPAVCKGLAFYKGQTLTFVEPGSVGGAFDVQAIGEIPGLATFLGATVNEVRITTGGSIPGQDYLAAQPPNGLTLGLLNPLNDASLSLEGSPGLNFNPAREAYLAGGAPAEDALVVNKNAGATTFAQFLATAKAGTARNITEATGTTVTVFRTLMAATGGITSVSSADWVSDFSSTNQEILGFQSNDGTSMYVPLVSECALLQGGQATAVATSVVPPAGSACRSYVASVPTIAQLAKTYGMTPKAKALMSTLLDLEKLTGLPTVTQTAVAGYKVDALRVALQWDFKQTALKNSMLGNDIDPKYQNPAVAKALYIAALKEGKTVACYLVPNGVCS